jgi:histidine triad (HIT) family protein
MSVFTKIVNGEIPSYKVAEEEKYYAFLDINPLTKGHTLVIPKQEINYIFDIDDELYNGLFLFAKKVALGIKKVIECNRIGIAVVGMEVPHAHIHLVPLHTMYDIDFRKPKLKLTKEEFEKPPGIFNLQLISFRRSARGLLLDCYWTATGLLLDCYWTPNNFIGIISCFYR